MVFLAVSETADASPCASLDAALWLLGDWVAAAPADSETLRLVEMAGEVFYVAKVQHNPYPVSFRLTDCSTTRLVFENPLHDFPRKLEYTLGHDGTMTVAVSDGADKGFKIHFQRPGNR